MLLFHRQAWKLRSRTWCYQTSKEIFISCRKSRLSPTRQLNGLVSNDLLSYMNLEQTEGIKRNRERVREIDRVYSLLLLDSHLRRILCLVSYCCSAEADLQTKGATDHPLRFEAATGITVRARMLSPVLPASPGPFYTAARIVMVPRFHWQSWCMVGWLRAYFRLRSQLFFNTSVVSITFVFSCDSSNVSQPHLLGPALNHTKPHWNCLAAFNPHCYHC